MRSTWPSHWRGHEARAKRNQAARYHYPARLPMSPELQHVLPTATERSPFASRIRLLLLRVASGELSADEAAASLRHLPFSDLGFARVDHHRELRQGTCEIVYAEGKTAEQLEAIVVQLLDQNQGPILVTRALPEHFEVMRTLASAARVPLREDLLARSTAMLRGLPRPHGRVLIVTAGTADLPVAREAALTATVLGTSVELEADVGVAGLHRLLALGDQLSAADAVVVVAGMEGALASVVGGLVPCLVIACPTSVGYGASFGGLAALLTMLSSCVPGVVTVNIDDGVGAGYAAGLVARNSANRNAQS